MLPLDSLKLMAKSTANIDEHYGAFVGEETIQQSLEGKEFQPAGATLSLSCHVAIEHLEVIGLFLQNIEDRITGLEGEVDCAFSRIGRVRVIGTSQKFWQVLPGSSDDVKASKVNVKLLDTTHENTRTSTRR